MSISKPWREGVCRTCPHHWVKGPFEGCQYVSRTLPTHATQRPQDLNTLGECPDVVRRTRAEGRA